MQRLTLALFGAAYICIALILAVILGQGAGFLFGVAVFIGTLGTLLAVHGLIQRGVARGALRRSEARSSEVHMLEDMVQRMGERLEHNLTHQMSAARPAGGRSAQSA